MIIVGERINSTRKRIAEAVDAHDEAFLRREATRQALAGAHFLDVNVGTRVASEIEDMGWLSRLVREAVECPLCVDSPNPEAIRKGLENAGKNPMINSTTGEKNRLETMVPLAVEFNALLVGLVMDENGIPHDAETRIRISLQIAEAAAKAGLATERLLFDPLIQPIGTSSDQGEVALATLSGIREAVPGARTICGLSNISFGLPERKLLNRTFLAMAIAAGLDACILDPLDGEMMAAVAAGEALIGQDDYCANYLTAFRAGKLGKA